VLYSSASSLPLQALFDSKANIDKVELRNAAQALAVMIGFSLPIVGMQRVFAGMQRAFFYHILFGVGSLISLRLLVMLSHRHAPIDKLLLATFGAQLLSTTPLLGVLAYRGLIGGFERIAFEHDARALLGQGGLFFILAVGGAIAWDSDFIILSKTVGAAMVAVYAVAVRMFQLVELPLQMANQPLWSAYADAKVCGSSRFLRVTLFRAFSGTLVVGTVGVALLVLLRDPILRVWVHKSVAIPLGLAVVMAIWTVVRASGTSFAMYLNGVRVVRPQVMVVIAFCILALPLKIWAAGRYSAVGLVLASLGCFLLTVWGPYLTFYRREWTRYLHDMPPEETQRPGALLDEEINLPHEEIRL
jgi:O-antigen/teichoic acid export membrane protein